MGWCSCSRYCCGTPALVLGLVLVQVLSVGEARDDTSRALREPALRRLPTGATKPSGWLKDELMLQAAGITGQLPSFWPFFNASNWVTNETGMSPAQYIPYYLNGLVPLSFQLPEDETLVSLRDRYIDYILSHQHPSGWLGTEVPRNASAGPSSINNEYWSKYLAVFALESYAEASSPGEKRRVIGALNRHMRAFFTQASTHSPAINASHWGYVRYEEAIAGIQWLLDNGQGTGETAFLWDLLHLIRDESDQTMATIDHTWQSYFSSSVDPFKPPAGWSPRWYSGRNPSHRPDPVYATVHALRHGVDIGQAMKLGSLWWRVSGASDDFGNAQLALEWAEKYLHMSDGMFMADEEIEGMNSPSRGTETCTVVETMFSMRTAYEITGNITFMDRLERIAFNALPAALWPDVTSNVYHHSSNQLFAVGPPFGYNLWFCCTSNVHQGWPKFVLGAVHTAATGELVISSYSPTVSNIPGRGTVHISGSYPWSDTATIAVSDRETAVNGTTVKLRIPCWTDGAILTLHGRTNQTKVAACAFALIYIPRNTKLNITFLNSIRLHTWHNSSVDGQQLVNDGGVEVHRGPLSFALRPAVRTKDTAAQGADAAGSNISTHDVAIAPGAKWNYALKVDSLRFHAGGSVPSLPFSADAPPPVKMTVDARIVPGWSSTSSKDARTGLQACTRPEEHSMQCGVNPLPPSPVNTSEPLETIELVPYGSTNLRISVFPTILKVDDNDAGISPDNGAAVIRPGIPWRDDTGNIIDAHGAGLLLHNGTYYWYGSRRQINASGTQMDGGIALYSSKDLYSWHFESIVVNVFNCSSNNTYQSSMNAESYPPPSCANGNGLDLERPKVVQCGGSGGKFVMWVRGTGYGNSPQLLAVLTSDAPTGPFTFASNASGSDDPFMTIAKGIKNYPAGYQFADATLFQDPQTYKTFVYWRTRITTGLDGPTGFRAMELTEDCLDVQPSTDTRIFKTPNREGPAMFFHKGLYYLWVSGTMGWSPTQMYLYSASTPLGDFANSSQAGHGWHSYTKGTTIDLDTKTGWNGTWTVRDGYLGAGSVWGPSAKQNVTLTHAKILCAGADDCVGFCFYDFDSTPAPNKLLSIAFKTRDDFVAERAVGLQPSPIPAPGQPGNRKPAQPGVWAYNSQSTFILPNPYYTNGSKLPPFIYMGDRWNFTAALGTSTATYIWLPLFVHPSNPGQVKVLWKDAWALTDPSLYPF